MKHMHAHTWHTYCTKKKKKKTQKGSWKGAVCKGEFYYQFWRQKENGCNGEKGGEKIRFVQQKAWPIFFFFFFFSSSLEVGMWKTVLLKEEHWDNKEIHFGMFSHVLWSRALYLLEWFDGCALYCPAENCTIVIFTGCTLVLGDRTTGGFQGTQSELWVAAY